MEKMLGDFVSTLRKADLEVSPAETLDAMQAMQIVGFENRRLLRDSLAIILAKTPEEKARFEVCFDRFFSFQSLRQTASPVRRPNSFGTESSGNGLPSEAHDGDEAPPGRKRRRSAAHHTSRLGHVLLSDDAGELEVMLRNAASVAGLEQIRTLRERSLYARRILLHMGVNALDDEIIRLQAGGEREQRTASALAEARAWLADRVREYVDNQYLLIVDGTGQRFLAEAATNTKLTNMQHYYFDHIREAVRKLAVQLAKRHAKRRKLNNRGHLDVRRTLRNNMQYDGALFDIKWKQIRVQRPRVFVICDVSGSVKNVARFLLTFLYSLNEVLPHVRAFAFSNDLGEVTDLFGNYPLVDAIEMSLDDWGKGSTDYGKAFSRFRKLAFSDLDNRSTVLILGDARNNYFEAGAADLKLIAGKARQVIWLNPESRDRWSEGDAEMKAYLPYCDFAEVCNSLDDLEKIVSRVLKSAH